MVGLTGVVKKIMIGKKIKKALKVMPVIDVAYQDISNQT